MGKTEFFRWLDTWLKPDSEAAKQYSSQQDSTPPLRPLLPSRKKN